MTTDYVAAIVGIVEVVKQLRAAVGSRQSNDGLRERLGYAADRLEGAKDLLTQLNAELAAVSEDRRVVRERLAEANLREAQKDAQIADLNMKLSQKRKFIPVGGVLVEVFSDGSLGNIPFCPTCQAALSDTGQNLVCGAHGGFISRIDADEFERLVAGLHRGV